MVAIIIGQYKQYILVATKQIGYRRIPTVAGPPKVAVPPKVAPPRK